MLRTLSFALAVAVCATPALAQDGSIGPAEIAATIDRQSPVSAVADPFSAPPTSDLAGRVIRFEEPIRMKGGEGASPLITWEYDRTAQSLQISLLPWGFQTSTTFMEGDRFVVPPINDVTGFQTQKSRTREGAERRSNAYGASTEVETFREVTYGFAAFSSDYNRRLPRSGRPSYDPFYKHQIRIEPEAARDLAQHLKLVVTATATDYEGRAVVCGTNYQEPSFRNPTEVLGRTCLVPARITSIAFVDGRDGSILREWR